MNEIGFNAAGNITRMSELRHTGNGQVLTVGLAVNPRRFDGAARKWVDGTPTFIDASVWGPQAEHAAASLSVGDRVVILGRLVTRTWTPADGPNAGKEQRRLEVVAEEIGPSLRWATAAVTKTAQRDDAAPDTEDQPV